MGAGASAGGAEKAAYVKEREQFISTTIKRECARNLTAQLEL